MSALNKILLIGHLGRDPEIKYTQGGSPVATFSIATTETWNDKSGTKQTHTEWHSIIAWNRLADLAKQYLAKGRQVYIEGKIKSREWTDREGNKRKTTEVIASQMVLLGSRGDSRPSESHERPTSDGGDGFDDSGITDSDIPF
jgi:single-strand DNA-binding protein